jgi:hypothetical protein
LTVSSAADAVGQAIFSIDNQKRLQLNGKEALFANTNKAASWSLLYFDQEKTIGSHGWPYLSCSIVQSGDGARKGQLACLQDDKEWFFQRCGGAEDDGTGEGVVIVGKKVAGGCEKIEFEAICA